ncbi:MAG: DUF1993 domain-containing protein [Proteobacteria bacterium]|nr:DUF1993 domain-containing protein [Pseudomonadota bacterium]
MALSMHEISVPLILRGLGQLEHVLGKGIAHARENNADPNQYVQARLAPDMLTLAGQVQRASDTAKATIARITGVEAPSFPDEESTMEQLIARSGKTRAFVDGVDRALFEGAAERVVEIKLGGNMMKFAGQAYLLQFGLPNFYFHITTAYDVLRNQGVPIGKRDYLGKLA